MPIKFGESTLIRFLKTSFGSTCLRGSSEKCLLEMSVDWHFPRLRKSRNPQGGGCTAPREIPEFRHHV